MITPEDEKTQEQKLEEEVAALKTRIKNTEYDLTHMFKGNTIIQQKLENTKKLLNEKENKLSELLGGDEVKIKEFHKFEDKLIEKDKLSVSKEQEKIINDYIEDEFV